MQAFEHAISNPGSVWSLPGSTTTTIGSGMFDQTEFLGGGGLQNMSLSIMGQSIVIPFSDLNVWLSRLGLILQAVTFLACARMVTRG